MIRIRSGGLRAFRAARWMVPGAALLASLLATPLPGRAEDPPPSPPPASGAADEPESTPAAQESTPWQGDLALGLSASTGKDDVASFSFDGTAGYLGRPHYVNAVLNQFISTKNGSTDADRTFLGAEYRYYARPETFGTLQQVFQQNEQQNLKFRSTTLAGLGRTLAHHAEREDSWLRDAELVAIVTSGYQDQRLSDPAANLETQRWVVQGALVFDTVMWKGVRWDNRVEATLPPLAVEEWRALGVTRLDLPILGNLSFRWNLTLDYLHGPTLAVRQNRQLTFLTSLGIAYAFGRD